ncbi:MAG: hypothetical protein G01um101425_555 [Candidatus Peregrinibacteria bacterium Gr01-1014_25]|nr:MAG: hypothetical protein G01um101425_555 [Candidatus Peregrinibacteria bacterium Gr01-1014_25]
MHASSPPTVISRSKLQLFLDCPRCFYLDRRLGIGRPDGPPFTLNNAVDALLKREFDAYRASGKPHPIMVRFGVDAIPFAHPDIDRWREPLRGGLQALHRPTGMQLRGAPDDLWLHPDGSISVVDYKATGSQKPWSLDDASRDAYKRQIEVYQWLLKQMGFPVHPTGYFVVTQARRDEPALNGSLNFTLVVVPYAGNDDWVDDALTEACACLQSDLPPPSTNGCPWCEYRREAAMAEKTL